MILVHANITSCLDYSNSHPPGFSGSGFTSTLHTAVRVILLKSDSVSLVIQSLQELPAHLYSGLGSLLEWVPCLLLPSWYTTRRYTAFSLLLNTAGTACCSALAAVPSG